MDGHYDLFCVGKDYIQSSRPDFDYFNSRFCIAHAITNPLACVDITCFCLLLLLLENNDDKVGNC